MLNRLNVLEQMISEEMFFDFKINCESNETAIVNMLILYNNN